MIWTAERIELLKELWGQQKTANEIAEILGDDISRNAIIGKAHRLGLPGRPSPIQRKKTGSGRSPLAMTQRMCWWPFGDPKKPNFYFCGKPVEISESYCSEHRAMAFQPTRKPLSIEK